MSLPDIPVRLPDQCDYAGRMFKGRLGADAKVQYSVQQPIGNTNSITVQPIPALFVANSGCAAVSTPSVSTTFNIPCGAAYMNSVLDTSFTCLNGTMTFVISTAAVGATAGELHLISSFASIIDNSTTLYNQFTIDQVAAYGLLQDLLLALYLTYSDRCGNYSIGWGCDEFASGSEGLGGTSGLNIAFAATGTQVFSFCFPILSSLGMLANTQYVPLGWFNGNLQWQFNSAKITPISSFCSAITTAGVMSSCTIGGLQIQTKIIDLGVEAGRMLRESIGPNLVLKMDAWQNQSATINSGTSGTVYLSTSARKKSIRSIFTTFGTSTVSGTCANGLYDAIVPGGCTGVNWRINNTQYPQYTLNPTANSAQCYLHTLDATGRSDVNTHRGSQTRYTINNHVVATSGTVDENALLIASGLRTLPAGGTCPISRVPCKFILGLNTETTTSPSMFAGLDSSTQDIQLVLTLPVSVGSNNIQANFFILYDQVVIIDQAGNPFSWS